MSGKSIEQLSNYQIENEQISELFKRYDFSHKVLSREEEKKLAHQKENGDKEARNKLILDNIKLAYRLTKENNNHHFPFDDLFEYALIGLVKAVDKYVPEEGKLSTYAYYWIKQSINRATRNYGRTIRIPAYKWQEFSDDPEQNEAIVKDFKRTDTSSLDKKISGSDTEKSSRTLHQQIGEECKKYNQVDQSEMVQKIFNELDDEEIKLLKLRAGLFDGRPRTLKQIGRLQGVTKERIRQKLEKIKKKLQVKLGSKFNWSRLQQVI